MDRSQFRSFAWLLRWCSDSKIVTEEPYSVDTCGGVCTVSPHQMAWEEPRTSPSAVRYTDNTSQCNITARCPVNSAVSMMSPLRPVDVRPQTLLLLQQGLLLLSPDALAAHDHHDRLVPCRFAVRRAARRFFLPLALLRAELFSALATVCYR